MAAVPRAGVIERLELRNFLCHDHLSMQLNPRTNWILGQNGSGKSALLESVMVALGAPARISDRGSNLRSFVRAGKNQAIVRVTLCNRGEGRYRVDLYGSSIVITRRISRSGQARLTVRAEEGKDREMRRAELDQVLAALHMDMTNPLVVTTQLTMKTFLENVDRHAMYELLAEGIGARGLMLNYRDLDQLVQELGVFRGKFEDHIKVEEEAIRQLEGDMRAKERYQEGLEQLEGLEGQLAWCRVRERERGLAEVERLRQQLREGQRITEGQVGLEEQGAAETESELSKLERTMEGVRERLRTARDRQSKGRGAVEESKRERDGVAARIRTKEREISLVQQDSVELQKLQEPQQGEKSERTRVLTERVTGLERELGELVEARQLAETEQTRVQKLLCRARRDADSTKEQFTDYKRARQAEQHEFQALRRESSTLPPAYGLNMARLIQRMDEAHAAGRFGRKPIGPIGLYVRVKDPKWALAVEVCLGQDLRTFHCNSMRDLGVLQELARDVMRGVPPMVASQFQCAPYDTTQTRARPVGALVSLLDVLDINRPEVANFLLDSVHTEEVLLCDQAEYKSALEMMSNPSTVPQNCRLIVTSQGDQIYASPLFRFYSAEQTEVRFLQNDRAEAMQAQEIQMMDTSEGERIMGEFREHREQVESQLREQKRLDSRIAEIVKREGEVGREIERSKEELEDLTQECRGWLQGQRDLQENREKERGMQGERTTLVESLARCEESVVERERELEGLSLTVERITEELAGLEGRLSRVRGRLEQGRQRVEGRRRELRGATEELLRLETKSREQGGRLVEERRAAARVCPKVQLPPDLTTKQLLAKKRALIKHVDNMKNRMDEKVEEKLEEKRVRLKKLQENYQKRKKVFNKLSMRLKKRGFTYCNVIQMNYLLLTERFNLQFPTQDYVGSLVLDHEKRSAHVELREGGGELKHNPSGGEKTFSAVALLRSLWSRLLAPFFMVDEFDVYLDPVNRATVLHSLIQAAGQNPDKQFVFLTPQATALQAGPEVTIHQLQPRGVAVPHQE